VLSYLVALRRHEIGVRLAIGAAPSRIITLVVRQTLKLVLAGMVCGLALPVPMAFAMRATFVAKVTAADPMVFLPTISVLLAVGILAAVVPALVRLEAIRSLHCGRNRIAFARLVVERIPADWPSPTYPAPPPVSSKRSNAPRETIGHDAEVSCGGCRLPRINDDRNNQRFANEAAGVSPARPRVHERRAYAW
jgi:FtsX-like permease family